MSAPAIPLRVTTRLSVSKATGDYRNEDFYAHSSRKGILGLSDGASISYDSATWAQLVAVGFVRDPKVTAEWIQRVASEYSAKHDRSNMSWMAQAAYDRGSYASLLGVVFHGGPNAIEVFAIGDSLAVLCDGDRIINTYPYSVPEEFDARPVLISSDNLANVFLKHENYPTSHTAYWDLTSLTEPSVLCVTDALGLWILSERAASRNPVAVLRNIRSLKQFSQFVEAERGAGRMRRDDTTLVVLR